jgi:hypothetical protein
MKLATAILALLAVPCATEPSAGRERAADPELATLHLGWVHESLDVDPDAARDRYERAADNPRTNREARAVALARLVELAQLRGDAEAADDCLRRLRELLPDERPLPAVDLEDLGEGFGAALALPAGDERDRRLEQLRARVAARDADGSLRPQRVVVTVVRAMVQERSDLERRLERQLAEARAEGELDRVVEVRRSLRELTDEASRRELLQSWMRSWRVRATRLLVEGELDEAERIRRLFRPGAATQELADDLSAAIASLGRLCEEPTLDEAERGALTELHARLEEQLARGEDGRVRDALTRLPYPLH